MTQSLSTPYIPPVPTRLERQFPKGSRVRLKVMPSAPSGVVVGHSSTRILVSWPEPAYRGHHRPETLEFVSLPGEAA